MKQHFKGMIWPRESMDAQIKKGKKTETKKVYRYVIIGMIVTDEPIVRFEGKNELLLDGPVISLVEPLSKIKSKKPNYKPGDANGVLLSLNDI